MPPASSRSKPKLTARRERAKVGKSMRTLALGGVVGEVLAEADAAGVVEIEAEADGAQGAGEGGEEVGGGGFVIPNVGTTAVAAAGMIVNAFEAVEFAIGGAEARGGDESGEIGAGGLLDDGGESGLAEGGGEAAGLLFEYVEVSGGVFRGSPGVGEAGGVVVAEKGVFLTFGRTPAAAARRAIGEVPGEEEGEIGVAAGRDGAVKAKSADGADFGGFGAEFAIGGKIVPEEHGGIPPASLFPAAEVSDAIVGGMEGGEGEAALEGIGGGKIGAGHEQAGEVGGGAVIGGAGFVRLGAAGGVFDGPGDGDIGGGARGDRARGGEAQVGGGEGGGALIGVVGGGGG